MEAFYDVFNYDYSMLIDELSSTIKGFKNDKWMISAEAPWFFFSKKNEILPEQGWKGHISARKRDAIEIVNMAFPILMKYGCQFKVLMNFMLLDMINDGHYPMGGANKFITFYPKDEDTFILIMHQLNSTLSKYEGPHIYTDYQCGSNSVLHYRYGAFIGNAMVNEKTGGIMHCIKNPHGDLVEDKREPWVTTPPWVHNPLESEKAFLPLNHSISDGPLGKYIFKKILQRANKGNVYLAIDSATNETVIIKEARYFVEASGYSYSEMLKNEYKILKRIDNYSFFPKVYEEFEFCDRHYLVEEYVFGDSLKKLLFRKEKMNNKDTIIAKIREAISVLHKEGIIHNDLTPNNIIIDGNSLNIYIIDFENSYEVTDGGKSIIHTPFYYNPENKSNNRGVSEDSFSFGLIMLSIYSGIVPTLYMDSEGVIARRSYSQKINDLIDYLIKNMRMTLEEGNRIRNEIGLSHLVGQNYDIIKMAISFLDSMHIEAERSTSENKRRIWSTTQFGNYMSLYSIQNGVAGIGEALLKICCVPKLKLQAEEMLKIIYGKITEGKLVENSNNLSDNSFLFGECGKNFFLIELARKYADLKLEDKIIRESLCKDYSYDKNDFALGIAGYGYTQLKLWLTTSNTAFLNNMMVAINKMEIIKPSFYDAKKYASIGFAHGYAGQLFFLAKVYKNSNEKGCLDPVLDILFNDYLPGIKKAISEREKLSKDVSWCKGLSGIGISLLELYAIVQENQLKETIELIAERVMEVYLGKSNCLCHGNASVIVFLMKAYKTLGEIGYKLKAEIVAEYIMLQSYLDKKGNVAFKDESKFSNHFDFGIGGMGTLYALLMTVISDLPMPFDIG